MFVSAEDLDRARASNRKLNTPLDIILDCWLKFTAQRPSSLRYYVAMWERTHWIVDSSVMLGLHPSQNPGVASAVLAEALHLWSEN